MTCVFRARGLVERLSAVAVLARSEGVAVDDGGEEQSGSGRSTG